MHEFRRILVGVDVDRDGASEITPGSERAALQARALAKATNGSVTLLHSTWEEDTPDPGVATPPGDVERAIAGLAERVREGGVDTSVVYGTDRPWSELVARSRREPVDLVIVGKRQEYARGERLVGTNARRLIRKCPCPVWVIHPARDPVERLVLAATDLGPAGDAAVAAAAHVADLVGAELHVVHSYKVPLELQLERESMDEAQYRAQLDAIDEAGRQHIIKALGRDVPPSACHIGASSPERAIRECVWRHQPDLVVLGTVSRGGIAGLVMGNTAERIVDEIDTSLLTVKPPGFDPPVDG